MMGFWNCYEVIFVNRGKNTVNTGKNIQKEFFCSFSVEKGIYSPIQNFHRGQQECCPYMMFISSRGVIFHARIYKSHGKIKGQCVAFGRMGQGMRAKTLKTAISHPRTFRVRYTTPKKTAQSCDIDTENRSLRRINSNAVWESGWPHSLDPESVGASAFDNLYRICRGHCYGNV